MIIHFISAEMRIFFILLGFTLIACLLIYAKHSTLQNTAEEYFGGVPLPSLSRSCFTSSFPYSQSSASYPAGDSAVFIVFLVVRRAALIHDRDIIRRCIDITSLCERSFPCLERFLFCRQLFRCGHLYSVSGLSRPCYLFYCAGRCFLPRLFCLAFFCRHLLLPPFRFLWFLSH